MSIKAMAWAWEQDVPMTEKIVLLALADHANDKGVCWPGQSGLAKKCGGSRRSINSILQRIEEKGLISSIRKKKEGRDVGKDYILILSGGVKELHSGCEAASQGGEKELHTSKGNHQEEPSSTVRETERQKPNPAVREVVSYFYNKCQEWHGFKPVISPADGKRAKEAIKDLSQDQVHGCIDLFLTSRKAKEVGCTLSIALSNHSINTFLQRGASSQFRDKPMEDRRNW